MAWCFHGVVVHPSTYPSLATDRVSSRCNLSGAPHSPPSFSLLVAEHGNDAGAGRPLVALSLEQVVSLVPCRFAGNSEGHCEMRMHKADLSNLHAGQNSPPCACRDKPQALSELQRRRRASTMSTMPAFGCVFQGLENATERGMLAECFSRQPPCVSFLPLSCTTQGGEGKRGNLKCHRGCHRKDESRQCCDPGPGRHHDVSEANARLNLGKIVVG
ncbi:hypothetical protein GE09DRAFT_425285 [Coniochaeta sp. 2T2.1]|nr:hypothetical protein GE09DRAFT_425285 [Coniochaeta sp. 2T2.1]